MHTGTPAPVIAQVEDDGCARAGDDADGMTQEELLTQIAAQEERLMKVRADAEAAKAAKAAARAEARKMKAAKKATDVEAEVMGKKQESVGSGGKPSSKMKGTKGGQKMKSSTNTAGPRNQKGKARGNQKGKARGHAKYFVPSVKPILLREWMRSGP